MEYDELNCKKCESIWCKIYTNKDQYIIVGVCYRSQEADNSEIEQLFECIKLSSDLNIPVLIMGDFNYPGINWEQVKADDLSSQHFLKLAMNCFLDQHVHTPIGRITY